MMQKLTKEQAEYLFGTMILAFQSNMDLIEMDSFAATQVIKVFEKILNQCTEKQFPTLSIRGSRGLVNIYRPQDGCVCIQGSSMGEVLTAAAFKEFTEGCQRILEWINEQENN